MRNVKKIEGGGKGGMEPKQVYEKNLSYISDYDVHSSLSQGIGYKDMAKLFVQIAPKSAGLYAANLKTWNDRNTNNADTKLSAERSFKKKPLPHQKKPLPAKPLSPEDKRKGYAYREGSMTPEEAEYYSKVGY